MDFKDLKDGMRFKCTFKGEDVEGTVYLSDFKYIFLKHNNPNFYVLKTDLNGMYLTVIQWNTLFETLEQSLYYNNIENFRILNRKEKLEQLIKDIENDGF